MSISVFIGWTILRDTPCENVESLRPFWEILIFGQLSWNPAFYTVKTEFWKNGSERTKSYGVKTTSGMFPRPVPTSDLQPFVRYDFLGLSGLGYLWLRQIISWICHCWFLHLKDFESEQRYLSEYLRIRNGPYHQINWNIEGQNAWGPERLSKSSYQVDR